MKKVLIGIIAILVMISIASFITTIKFNVKNPFVVLGGLVQVLVADAQYVQLQDNPRVIIAKPTSDEGLVAYMEARGYKEVEEDRVASLLVFSNGEMEEQIFYSLNAYYTLWEWAD